MFVVVTICRTGESLETGKIGCCHLSDFSVLSKEKNHYVLLAADYSSS